MPKEVVMLSENDWPTFYVQIEGRPLSVYTLVQFSRQLATAQSEAAALREALVQLDSAWFGKVREPGAITQAAEHIHTVLTQTTVGKELLDRLAAAERVVKFADRADDDYMTGGDRFGAAMLDLRKALRAYEKARRVEEGQP